MYLVHYGDSNLSKSLEISCTDRLVENSNTGIYITEYKLVLILKKLQVILK